MFEDLNLLNKDIHYIQYYAGKVSMLFEYFFAFALAFARYSYPAYLFFWAIVVLQKLITFLNFQIRVALHSNEKFNIHCLPPYSNSFQIVS